MFMGVRLSGKYFDPPFCGSMFGVLFVPHKLCWIVIEKLMILHEVKRRGDKNIKKKQYKQN